jgi:hypothetical protein
MTQPLQNRLGVWDFGWCDHERIALSRAHSPEEVIRAYCNNDVFGTTFIYPESPIASECHGPFLRSALSESDFELITPQRFRDAIADVLQFSGFAGLPSAEACQAVRRLTDDVSSRHEWLFMLRFTEDDKDRFHEAGWVLNLFREFICASPDAEYAERLVFGYD